MGTVSRAFSRASGIDRRVPSVEFLARLSTRVFRQKQQLVTCESNPDADQFDLTAIEDPATRSRSRLN